MTAAVSTVAKQQRQPKKRYSRDLQVENLIARAVVHRTRAALFLVQSFWDRTTRVGVAWGLVSGVSRELTWPGLVFPTKWLSVAVV